MSIKRLVQFRHFLLLAALHVDRQRADDPEHFTVATVNMNALAARQSGIMSADAAEIDEAVVIDIRNLKGDLVRVAFDHDLGRAFRIQNGHRIAVGVGLETVGKRPDIIEPDALASRLIAGGVGVLSSLVRNSRDSGRMQDNRLRH